MKVTDRTPASEHRGPVRVAHTEYGWDEEEMVGHDVEGDIVVLASGERLERRWVLREGAHLRSWLP